MNYKKSYLLIFSLLLLFIFIFKSIDSSANAVNEIEDLDPPTINKVIPSKCQEYIVGKPKISVKFKDNSGVDLSTLKLYVNYKDVTKECKIFNNEITYTPKNKFKRGNQIVKIELCDLSKNKNRQEFEWYFTVGTPIYTHYRGLLHSHTKNSDGSGTYEDAYYLAKYKAQLDFFAITEHSNLLDNNLMCNLNDASYSSKWTNLIKCSNDFTNKGEFIALTGFEMTYDTNKEKSNGHINVFNTNGFLSSNDNNLTLDRFYQLISKNEDLIGQFNHPCEKFGMFNNFKYSPLADKVICLLEVGNGSNEYMKKNIRSYDMYQLALDNGWHVAPTCNQDNHKVNFGVANEFRTVILSTDLTKDALYDGLKNMRVYATEDKNLKIDYTINDSPLGTTLKKPSKLNFSVSAVDNNKSDIIKEVQIISNNGVIIKKKNFNSNFAKLDFTIKPKKNAFYYVKVIQNKDKISVTAPIWIKLR